MIQQLLFVVVLGESLVAAVLMVRVGPLREVAMQGVEQLKAASERGSVTVKVVGMALVLILVSTVASILKIQSRSAKLGSISPMDQVLWRTRLLDSSLIGYTLFLAFVIDRLHHYLLKAIDLRETADASEEEVEKLENENQTLRDKDRKSSDEASKLQQEVAGLEETLRKLGSQSRHHEVAAEAAERRAIGLQKQFEELFLEYSQLLEDNQSLQAQALASKG